MAGSKHNRDLIPLSHRNPRLDAGYWAGLNSGWSRVMQQSKLRIDPAITRDMNPGQTHGTTPSKYLGVWPSQPSVWMAPRKRNPGRGSLGCLMSWDRVQPCSMHGSDCWSADLASFFGTHSHPGQPTNNPGYCSIVKGVLQIHETCLKVTSDQYGDSYRKGLFQKG